jgi:hypothetical protein
MKCNKTEDEAYPVASSLSMVSGLLESVYLTFIPRVIEVTISIVLMQSSKNVIGMLDTAVAESLKTIYTGRSEHAWAFGLCVLYTSGSVFPQPLRPIRIRGF